MRVVANYSTSLFDYINSDKNLKEVLSQGADESLLSEGAKKTLREKGISLNGSTTKDASVPLAARDKYLQGLKVIVYRFRRRKSFYDSRKLGQYGKDCNRSEVICGKL